MELDSDEELRERYDALRERAVAGEQLDDLLFESFALTREAAKRTLGQRHFDVQLIGGMVLHDGSIAEMKTGEGKTLTSTLPICLNALAARDAEGNPVQRQGRPPGHGQRLPGPARRRVDEADLRPARHHRRDPAVRPERLRRQARRLRGRRHLRHQLRVRLRLPARQPRHRRRGEVPARPPVRDRRRGRQHPDRRGAHAADHLRRARAGRRPLLQVRRAGAADGAGQEARGHRGQVEGAGSPTSTSSPTRSTRPSRSPSAASRRPRSSSASTTCTRPSTATSSTTCSRR